MKRFFREAKSLLIIFALVFTFRSSILNWYVIPSGSLLPSLKIGDHVVVNKLSYGFMLPFMNTQVLSWGSPKRGDIVVFKGPKGEKDLTMIKRVVGLPGDVVSFTNGVLTVNGVQAKETQVYDTKIRENFGGGEIASPFNIYEESGFSKAPHYIMRLKSDSPTEQDKRVWIVPENKLLLLGDNRDNSADGRFWGYMDIKRIYGRAFGITYSTYRENGSFVPKFRSDRWFAKITR